MNKKGIRLGVTAGCLWILLLVQSAMSQTNVWTKSSTGAWNESVWSLGILPSSNHTAVVTNGGSKAVFITSTTRDSFLSSMTVSNLLLSDLPTGTNTILLNFIGTSVPFRVLNNCTVGSNGVLINFSSELLVERSDSTLFVDGGMISQDGGSNIFNGTCYIGYTNSGIYNLTNGTTTANSVLIGNLSSGTFNQYGGIHNAQNLTVSGGASSLYNLSGGTLQANSVTIATFNSGQANSGNFIQSGGSVVVTNNLSLCQIFAGTAHYSLSAGTLQSGSSQIGNEGLAIFDQSGGSHRTGALQLGTTDDRLVNTCTYNLNQGLLTATSINVTVNSVFNQTDGTNSIAGPLTLSASSYALSGGVLKCSDINDNAARMAPGLFSQTGGTCIVSNQLAISGQSFGGGFSQARLQGGNLDCGSIRLDDDCNFFHTAGSITNRISLILNGGIWNADNVQESLGSVVLNNTSRDQLGTNPCVQQFASSLQNPWSTNAQFIIIGWQQGIHHIYFGNSASGLTLAQLSQIRFGLDHYAKILDTGEIVPTSVPPLLFQRSGSNLILSWPSGVLQSATNVTGPYADMVGTYSPYTNSFSSPGQRFFRLAR